MKVLVSAASRHGATAEIAKAIGETLEAAGLEVAILPPDTVTSLAGIDAVVLGSGVYVGHWLEPARDLVERLGAELAARPVWLFSSGPIGDPPKPEEDPVDLPELMTATGARGHRLFSGLVDKSRLGLGEKVILAAVRAPEGDYRPWDEIRAWAGEIAAALARA
jgi:menaquinone-dependent protoporphyrinogen oxidase